jgi:RNA polymerase sigma-70 factor, ECF subfamily
MSSPSPSPTLAVAERELLDRARAGDERAFHRLVEGQRAELHAHCYRMLGSLHDAEDALQDALLRAWRALPRFEGRSSLRTWLFRIATNACLDVIAKRPKRVLPVDYGPPAGPGDPLREPVTEPIWVEPYPDEEVGVEDGFAAPEASFERRESIELAFIAALQHLPARQRAALILREVLGFSANEVAESLETTVPAVNSALQRARKAIDEQLPDRNQQATLRSLGDEGMRDFVERFVEAFEGGDVDAILALLAEDATFAMPPYPDWYRGREEIGDSWLMPEGPPLSLRYVPTRANGQLALGTYHWDPDAGAYLPVALDVLALEGPLITEILCFRDTESFARFGLPETISGEGP